MRGVLCEACGHRGWVLAGGRAGRLEVRPCACEIGKALGQGEDADALANDLARFFLVEMTPIFRARLDRQGREVVSSMFASSATPEEIRIVASPAVPADAVGMASGESVAWRRIKP